MKYLLFIVVLGLFIGCGNNDDGPIDKFVIYDSDGTKITLIDVRDSRCPIDSFCIWQGNAEVEMRITHLTGSENFILNTAGFTNGNLDFPKSIAIFGLEIELLDLLPYPQSDQTYDLEDYVINISINR